MGVKKNVQFTKLIKAGGRLREFNFRKSQGTAGAIFNVDVPDERDNRYYIVFKQVANEWTAEKTNLPSWLVDALPQIEIAIKESENGS
jgi:hypothetical protein